MATSSDSAVPTSENELIAVRQKKAEEAVRRGFPAYPDADALRPTTTAGDLLARYGDETREALELRKGPEDTHRIAGRLIAIRNFGKGAFCVLRDRDGSVQIFVSKGEVGDEGWGLFELMDVGDFVGVEGTPMRSKKGDFALAVTRLQPLAKTVRPLPEKWHGLTDKETRYRQRYVDLIANQDVAKVFRSRSKIVRGIRNFLDAQGFLEVETPMMHPLAGGAAARPFVTHHNALDLELYMRIAPELYLKRLVVGGLDRVYEINRNFRNEGLSLQHNPEFTMLEFYVAYRTYRDLMDLTEDLISGLATDVLAEVEGREAGLGAVEMDYHYDLGDRTRAHRLNFAKPWARTTVHESVARVLGVEPDALRSLGGAREAFERAFGRDVEASAEAWAKFRAIRAMHEDEGVAAGHVVYAIFEEKVEPTLIQPTFVHDFPIAVSPLARRKDGDPTLADRFELFIAGREIANAFSELNDPRDQESRFRAQVHAKAGGDEEAMPYDADYIRALEYGLPPTAGEGIGIDRLVMLLTDQASIRDVILFPLMRPEAR